MAHRSIAPVALATALVVAAIPLAAGAQPKPKPVAPAESAPDEPTRRYLEGKRLLRDGDAERALAELRASMALLPSPNTELLVAHALRQLGKRVEAIRSYEHVVEVAGDRVRAGEERFRDTLADAGRWVALSRAELAELRISVAHAPAGATLHVDGEAVTTAPEPGGALRARVWHEPGSALVEVRSGGAVNGSRKADLKAGTTPEVTLDLAPSPGPSWPPPVPSWIAAGVGVAGLGVFTVFRVMADSEADELRSCEGTCDAADPVKTGARDRGERDVAVSNVALVVGLTGLAAAGAIWFFYPRESGPTARVSDATLAVGPTGIQLRGTF